MAQDSLNRFYWPSLMMFGPHDSESAHSAKSMKWKIKRDVRDRGYSIQKVLDSIVKREEDFNEFIRPQKEHADLIVKFSNRNSCK
jgi:uridine kinase